MQDLTRIDRAAAAGDFARNQVLTDALRAAERVHIIGLVSGGGVHSSLDHLHALISLAAELEVPDLVVHAFTDGRDTLPHSGAEFLEEVEGWMAEAGAGPDRLGWSARYYAMDRDRALGTGPARLRPARARSRRALGRLGRPGGAGRVRAGRVR